MIVLRPLRKIHVASAVSDFEALLLGGFDDLVHPISHCAQLLLILARTFLGAMRSLGIQKLPDGKG
jgi:hypothetical protein